MGSFLGYHGVRLLRIGGLLPRIPWRPLLRIGGLLPRIPWRPLLRIGGLLPRIPWRSVIENRWAPS